MSCSHLLVCLPLPLLPSILASKMCLSSVSWLLMCPKYLSFSVFAFCRSMLHTHKRQLGIPLSLGLCFVFLHCPFQIEIIFVNRLVAIASLLLISGVFFPFASILAPRYSKLLTLSISSPSIAILASNNKSCI